MLRRQYVHQADLSAFETAAEPRFLEGTGSLILDRVNKLAYAAISLRTDATVVCN